MKVGPPLPASYAVGHVPMRLSGFGTVPHKHKWDRAKSLSSMRAGTDLDGETVDDGLDDAPETSTAAYTHTSSQHRASAPVLDLSAVPSSTKPQGVDAESVISEASTAPATDNPTTDTQTFAK